MYENASYCTSGTKSPSPLLPQASQRSGEADIRMLVHQSQAGAIIGKAGAKIKELREVSLLGYHFFTFFLFNW